MPVGKPLHLRLFIEGEESPVISAQINVNINGPATASIQIVPLDQALQFLPRSMVHLFYLDTFLSPQAKGIPSVPTQQQAANPDPTVIGEYKLLYSGEIIGFSFIQTPQSRALVLQCLDFSSYWDSLHVTALTFGPQGNAFDQAGSLYGGKIGTFTDIPGDSAAEHIVNWIRQTPESPGLTTVGGLAGGIIHMMEVMGGIPGHEKGVNDFFTVAELRCRLLSQLCAEENDDTAARVLAGGVFEQWLKNGIQQAGGNITYRDLMKILFQYIFYEFVPNPSAKFDDASKQNTTNATTASNPAVRKLLPTLTGLQTMISGELSGSTMLLSSADYGNFQLDAQHIAAKVDKASKDVDAVRPRYSALNQAYDYLRSANNALTQFAFKRQDITPSVELAKEQVQAAFNSALDYLQRAIAAIQGGSFAGVIFLAQRLRSQIIRPDCWFASPPACNVIFPEMYSQISYDRNFLSETTRLSVAVFLTLIGRASLLADYTLAPASSLSAQALAKYKGESAYRVLMDHELHVGIIPRIEWVPDTGATGAPTNPAILKTVKADRVAWTVRAGLFHFFKYRFSARTASVQGRFNPALVCGFPGVIITRPYIIAGGMSTLKSVVGAKLSNASVLTAIHEYASDPTLNAPSHLVGLVGGYAHNIDQNGGTTSASLHCVRQHRGIDDEFLGVLTETSNGPTPTLVKTILNLSDLQNAGDQKGINLLASITPQSVVPQPGLANRTKAALSQSRTVPVMGADGSTTDSVFTFTSAVESNNSVSLPASPMGTKEASLNTQGRTGLVPSPPGKVTLQGKGYYGGVIKDIELFEDTTIAPVTITSTVTKSVAVLTTTPSGDDVAYVNQASLAPKTVTSSKTVSGTVMAYTSAAIYEEIQLQVGGTLPVEELLRPNWFSPAYSNLKIGSQIYQPFFGCNAVVDGLTVQGTNPQTTSDATETPTIASQFSSPTGKSSLPNLSTVVANLQTDAAAAINSSLEKALNVLGYLYGQVKLQGLDVDDFVRSYTNRSIATKNQILGDDDLRFDVSQAPKATVIKRADGTSPEIGFHSAAINIDLVKAGGLTGLISDLSTQYTRVGNIGAKEPLRTRYDVRMAKRQRVINYINALALGPGFKG